MINTDASSGVECEIFLERFPDKQTDRIQWERWREKREEMEREEMERGERRDNETFHLLQVPSLFNLQIFEEPGKPPG